MYNIHFAGIDAVFSTNREARKEGYQQRVDLIY
jgi:hypothetical protein